MIKSTFLLILNMSYVASFAILAIIIIRLFLKKAPRIYSYILWGIILFRLLCPYSFESFLGLLPSDSTVISLNANNYSQNEQISSSQFKIQESDLSNFSNRQNVNTFSFYYLLGILWILVSILLFSYNIVSMLKLKHKLKKSVLYKENIYITDSIETPFVLGILKPKIYLPNFLSEREKNYIILHEQKHINRFDHIFRFLSFIALCLHWYNPLVWLAFALSEIDMEMSCDEAVLKDMGNNIKKEYSYTLLSFANKKSRISQNSFKLAFGKNTTKTRIKNILNYKHSSKKIVISCIILIVLLSLILLSNPINNDGDFLNSKFNVTDIIYSGPQYSYIIPLEQTPEYCITDDLMLFIKEKNISYWTLSGELIKQNINSSNIIDMIFYENILSNNDLKKIRDTKNIYKLETNDFNNTFFLLLESKDGTILLAQGYDFNNVPNLRYLFDMKKTKKFENKLSTTKILEHRTKYVGNNSKVSNIIYSLDFPQTIKYDHLSLKTDKKPYEVTINFTTDITNKKTFEKKYNYILMNNSCIMFSLIQNVEIITFNINDSFSISFSRDWANSLFEKSIWEYSNSKESYKNFLITLSKILKN